MVPRINVSSSLGMGSLKNLELYIFLLYVFVINFLESRFFFAVETRLFYITHVFQDVVLY